MAFGLYRARTDGRFRTSTPAPPAAWHGHELGERATLIQFSSAFCAPCRVTRRILEDVAATEEGVVHVDIDAEAELALVRELGIVRTPTTLILNSAGEEIARAAGAPRKEQVLSALPHPS
ncbi:thioredoxin family protein [Nocardioides sp. Kera G14]|uniref:thioredoxin family protein n=1 Tax=Nocardioides sp. Kera G14 TaxID=2884264 RepID=UPI001D0F7F1D|nr:thioredoxin family protein [Nocardioides sp. Kera G14]UDY23128.1 thioredoxin family protein [Nocardioides sp. Kera G14]